MKVWFIMLMKLKMRVSINKKMNKLTIVVFMFLNFESFSLAENNFFEKGKNKYDEKKI